MLDLLVLGTEEVSESDMTKAFTEFAEVRFKDLLERQAAEEKILKVRKSSGPVYKSGSGPSAYQTNYQESCQSVLGQV